MKISKSVARSEVYANELNAHETLSQQSGMVNANTNVNKNNVKAADDVITERVDTNVNVNIPLNDNVAKSDIVHKQSANQNNDQSHVYANTTVKGPISVLSESSVKTMVHDFRVHQAAHSSRRGFQTDVYPGQQITEEMRCLITYHSQVS